MLAAVMTPQADQVFALVARAGDVFIDPRTVLQPGPGFAPLSEPEAEPLNGGILVLSANERAVFSLGGTVGEGDTARAAGVRRYSTLERASTPVWNTMAFDVTLGEVLAASYSAPERALYALDAVGGQARLLRLDLQTHEARTLGSWSFGGADRVFLSAVLDGAMLLGTTSNGSFQVSQFSVQDGELMGGWYIEGEGTLAEKPTLRRAGLDVILVNGNGMRGSQRLAIPGPSTMGSPGRQTVYRLSTSNQQLEQREGEQRRAEDPGNRALAPHGADFSGPSGGNLIGALGRCFE